MQRVMRASLAFQLAAVLLVGASCSRGDAEKAKAPPQGPPPVKVAQPLVDTLVDWDDFVGRFQAVKTVEVRPRVTGYLERIAFKDGDIVRAGQLLFVIDPRPYQATLAQARAQSQRARANLALARTQLDRAKRLLTAEAISREEYDQRAATVATAQADLAAAEADVRTAALNVEFTQVRAPITGRVSDRRVDLGNLVSGNGGSAGTQSTASNAAPAAGSGTLLTTIVSTDPIYFVFDGSEALYLKYARANQAGTRPSSRNFANPVEIRLQDEPNYRIKGRMNFVDNAINQGTGTIRGRAVIDNPGGFLTPGMFGRLRLLGSGRYQALLIPDEAIQTDQSRQAVLVVGSDGTVQPRVVTPGPVIGGLRVIREGLQPGDRVVVDGFMLAQPGRKVSPILTQLKQPQTGAGSGAQEAAAYTPPASPEATFAR